MSKGGANEAISAQRERQPGGLVVTLRPPRRLIHLCVFLLLLMATTMRVMMMTQCTKRGCLRAMTQLMRPWNRLYFSYTINSNNNDNDSSNKGNIILSQSSFTVFGGINFNKELYQREAKRYCSPSLELFCSVKMCSAKISLHQTTASKKRPVKNVLLCSLAGTSNPIVIN